MEASLARSDGAPCAPSGQDLYPMYHGFDPAVAHYAHPYSYYLATYPPDTLVDLTVPDTATVGGAGGSASDCAVCHAQAVRFNDPGDPCAASADHDDTLKGAALYPPCHQASCDLDQKAAGHPPAWRFKRHRVPCGRRLAAFFCGFVVPFATLFMLFGVWQYGPLGTADERYMATGNCTVLKQRILDARPGDVGLLPALDVLLISDYGVARTVALKDLVLRRAWVANRDEVGTFFAAYAVGSTYECYYDYRAPGHHVAMAVAQVNIVDCLWAMVSITAISIIVVCCGVYIARGMTEPFENPERYCDVEFIDDADGTNAPDAKDTQDMGDIENRVCAESKVAEN